MEELLWFIGTLIIGGAIVWLVLWLRKRRIAVRWWEWLIGAVGLLAIVLAIQHLQGSMAEGYPQAGWMGALAMAIPGLVMLLLVNQLVMRRYRGSKS